MSKIRSDRSEATRAALVKHARRLFARDGYAGTATTAVCEAAGVTRGALYHHFADKLDLFEAVYEDVERDVVARVYGAVGPGDGPLDQLRSGAKGFLDACREPDVRQIVLLDGPSVLGWQRWRDLDQRYGLGVTRTALMAGMEAGAIRELPVDCLAHVVLAALNEAALLLAHKTGPKTRAAVDEVVDALIDGLAAPAPAKRRGG